MPGSLIPHLYFDYLRTQHGGRLEPVFEHNALDILSLACLTGIVPHAFRNPSQTALQHGAELLGVARWVAQTGDPAEARTLLMRAVDAGLPDDLTFRTLWEVAMLDRKQGDNERSLAGWRDLAECRNAYRLRALEELPSTTNITARMSHLRSTTHKPRSPSTTHPSCGIANNASYAKSASAHLVLPPEQDCCSVKVDVPQPLTLHRRCCSCAGTGSTGRRVGFRPGVGHHPRHALAEGLPWRPRLECDPL
ncbi:MAG: ribonuclease H-like domain-containing protein [Acidobacteriota bacterium]